MANVIYDQNFCTDSSLQQLLSYLVLVLNIPTEIISDKRLAAVCVKALSILSSFQTRYKSCLGI